MSLFQYKNAFDDKRNISSICIKPGVAVSDKYTFIVPTYKRPYCLCETVDSILAQDYKGLYNIIICDNNPERNDETEIIMEKYSNVEYLAYYKHHDNIGPAGNWNRLIELCVTTHAIMVHDDDKLLPDFLSRMNEILECYPDCSFLKCAQYRWNGNKSLYQSTRSNLLYKYSIKENFSRFRSQAPTGCIMNVSDIKIAGGFDSDDYPSFDYITVLNMLDKGKYTLLLDEKLMLYRIVGNDTSNPMTQIKLKELNKMVKKALYVRRKVPFVYYCFASLCDFISYNRCIQLSTKGKNIFNTICYSLPNVYVRLFRKCDDLIVNLRCKVTCTPTGNMHL